MAQRNKDQEPRSKAVTSYDVARRAGVSQATVSRAFSRNGYVSDAARQRILEAAKELRFRPNAIARGLITRRSRLVAVVMADVQYSFYLTLLHELHRSLHAEGYQALLKSMPSSADIDGVIPDVLSYQVDGVIVASARLSSRASLMCRDADIPIVLVNRYVAEDDSFSSVGSDNIDAGRKAAAFLLAAGHKHLAFIAGLADTSTSADRERGFFDEVSRQSGRQPARRTGDFTYEGGSAAARELMNLTPRPDAIFCASDIMAIGAMDVIRSELGLRVPEDVSVIGFNNALEASWTCFDLTTIAADIETMSWRAVDMLTYRMDSRAPRPQHEYIKGRLIVRGSARRPDAETIQRLGAVEE